MHICNDCGTIIHVYRTPTKKPSKETIRIVSTPGKDICVRCVAIVVNLMSGETLIASGSIQGWNSSNAIVVDTLPTSMRD